MVDLHALTETGKISTGGCIFCSEKGSGVQAKSIKYIPKLLIILIVIKSFAQINLLLIFKILQIPMIQ